MNEIYYLILLIIGMALIYYHHKFYLKRGLYFALVLLNIMTFILSFKIAYIFKMNINIGILPFILTLTVIYAYIIKYGIKDIKNIMQISLYTNISIALFLIVMNYYIPAITETISINMTGSFEYNYKLLITYPIIMYISQYLVIKLYSFVSKIQDNIIISTILTYILTALLYTVIFYIIGYIKIMPIKDSIFLGITTYIMGLIISLISSIFLKLTLGSKKVKKWEILF